MEEDLLVRKVAAEKPEPGPRELVIESSLGLRAGDGQVVVGVRVVEQRRAGVQDQESRQR